MNHNTPDTERRGHTPGPWRWMEAELNDRMAKRLGKPRSKLSKRDGALIFALKGPYNGPNEANGDRWDFRTIMELAWSDVKVDTMHNVTPSPADRALIAAAPDLYEACKMFDELEADGYVIPKGHRAAFDACRAALIKAGASK